VVGAWSNEGAFPAAASCIASTVLMTIAANALLWQRHASTVAVIMPVTATVDALRTKHASAFVAE